ncbi:DUF748 domain-containing protein [Fulvivirgaceae bacterium PWU5]|uniref:DUF748 domain-containing protein n=1 Tax=Dawidia cretensis TaxID=2782350 RepID=A0AAP2E5B4_9BACT|nr:DUF748 domain-containing protein [Dawidia cretensis]MBT1712292.1 DUF748 domain-containing protein [Dawidia cretensis]
MKRKKILLIFAACILVLGVLAFVGYTRLPAFLQQKARTAVADLKQQGIDIHYDSLHIDLAGMNVAIDSFELNVPAQHLHLRSPRIEVSTIKLLPLLFRKRLHIAHARIDHPILLLTKPSVKDSVNVEEAEKKQKTSSFALKIDSLHIPGLTLVQTDTVQHDTLSVSLHFTAAALTFDKRSPQAFDVGGIRLDSTRIVTALYTFGIHQLTINKTLQQLEADTITIKPRYSKRAFARRMGYEVDRFDGLIPYLSLRNFHMGTGDSTFFTAGRLETSTTLRVYRNKHYPFPNKTYTPLPIDALKRIPFYLRIDTLRLVRSYISYEEVGEKADSSGTVFFEDLNATLTHITQDSSANPPVLVAAANFMGKGKLAIQCTFSRTKKPAHLKGTLVAFPLPSLNDVLQPQAGIKIESGVMSRLAFQFRFNDIRSDGSVDLSYHDLKVAGLRKTKKKDRRKDRDKDKDGTLKNEFLSFALNTFIQDDAGKLFTGEKKTGTVLFYRDRKKAIFNFWWKSLFSGIKSSFNIENDKARGKKRNKE